MTKKVIVKLLVCALLCAAAVTELSAQPPADSGQNPGARGGFGAGVGGFRGGGGGRRGGFGQPAVPVGPPAPVPAEVAQPRPTPQELTKLNADFKQFLASSPDADLLTKYPNLTVAPKNNNAIVPTSGGVRGPRHQAFVETAKNGDFDILFEGDSITDWWQQQPPNGGAEVFKKYFGDQKVANFAVAGDTTQGLLWGLQDGEGKGHKPKVIMLMIGTNNTGGNTGAEIAEGVGADVAEMRKDFPDAKILLLAIFPRGSGPNDANRRKNEEANKIIAKLDDGQHVFFKNINDKFLDSDGKLIGFRGDNLHPTAVGYEAWGATVAPILKDMLK